MRTQQDNVSKALSTVPGSWEMPRKCQLLPSLPMMITDILTTSQAQAQAKTRHFPCSILLTITETLSPVHHGACRKRLCMFKPLTKGKYRCSQTSTYFSFLPSVRLWCSPSRNVGVQMGLPPPRLQHRQTLFGVLRHLGPKSLSKRKPSLLAKSSRTLVSVLTKVPSGGGSLEMGPLFTLPPMGKTCYHRVGSVPSLRDGHSPWPSNSKEWTAGR